MLPDHVQAFIDAEIAANRTDFSDLRAVILNETLKPSRTPSHTGGLIEVSARVLRGVGARVDTIRVVDHPTRPNMLHTARRLKEHGGLPAYGNVTTNRDFGNPTHPNPEYR
ncbi:MAG: hypothetical protein H0X12_14160 [Nocardioides sp.]|nr:hypothetical protein [Nocardioides sp.]